MDALVSGRTKYASLFAVVSLVVAFLLTRGWFLPAATSRQLGSVA